MTPSIQPSQNLPKLALLAGKGDYSGVPRYIELLSCALDGLAEITIISDTDHGGFGFARKRKLAHIEIPGLRTHFRPLLIFRSWRSLSKLLKIHNFNIVSAHTRTSILLLRLIVAKRAVLGQSIPRIFVTYHGLPFATGQRKHVRMISLALERFLVRAMPPHCLVFLSDRQKKEFTENVGASVCRKHILLTQSNCSNLGLMPETSRPADSRRIVMTSRVGYQKNLESAITLFSHLPLQYRLVLCGPGTNAACFRAKALRIAAKSVISRIEFVGPVADVRPYLAVADCYLLTSRYEGLPIGAIEAFEAGLPLALSDIAGNSELSACHPFSITLHLHDFESDAAQLHQHISSFIANRASHRKNIQKIWQKTHSFGQWKVAVANLYCTTKFPERRGATRFGGLKRHLYKLACWHLGAKGL